MDVTATSGGLSITMPPANQVSTGENVLFTNPGSNTYTVLKNDGTTLVSVTAGQQVMIYITDNTTAAGTWNSFLFGSGSSALSAATIVGYGTKAIGNTLNIASPVTVTSTNTTIGTSDRGATYIWNGAVGTFTLPLVATATSDFFFEIRNQGSGSLTLSPQAGELIDGQSSIVLQINESCIVHAGVSLNWYTVGRGRSTQFNFTQLVKTVTGGTTTLTQTEAANVVQKYIGALLSSQIVVVPAVVQVYYIANATSGAYTFTVESPTPGTTVDIPTGQNAILFCDGVNVINASTTLSGISSLTLATASAASPSLNFSGNTTTGLFQPATGTIGFSSSGSEVGRITQYGYNAISGSAAHPSYAFTSSPTTGMYSAGANQINFSNNGVLSLSASSAGAWSFVNNLTVPTINKVTITTPATGSTLTLADGKTLTASNTLTFTGTDGATAAFGAGLSIAGGKSLTVSNTLTFTGTDGSSVAFGGGGTAAYRSDNLGVFAATTSAQLAGVISDETGSGALVFATSPTLVTPTLGAASATTINKVTITAPATGSTLTIADGKTISVSGNLTTAGNFTLSGAFASTFTFTNTTSVTFPTSGTLLSDAAAVTVAQGGTGRATLTNHGVLVGAGTSAITQLAAADTGTVMIGGGASADPSFSTNPVLGKATVATGSIGLAGTTSGTVTIQPQAVAGTYNFNLPTSAGSSGQPLLSGGGGVAAQTYGTLGAQYGGTGLDGSAAAQGAVPIGNGSGYTLATLSAGNGITITNGAGSITISSAAKLLATLTPTVAANVDALSAFTSSYDAYLIVGEAIVPPAATNVALQARFGNAGSADTGSNYVNFNITGTTSSTTATSFNVSNGVNVNGTASGNGIDFCIFVTNANSASLAKKGTVLGVTATGGNTTFGSVACCFTYIAANSASGIRFFWAGGQNFQAQGKIYIYGLANA
jgi:hypothetical protein